MSTTSIAPLQPALGSSPTGEATPRPRTVQQAAQQFEALLIAELLRMSHGDEHGWLGTGQQDSTASSAMEYAEESLAQSIAAQGGLGLSGLIARHLASP
jgi:Rod binding domain-containing protein